MYVKVGECAKCGAPIYASGMWGGTCPPPSEHSCNCFKVSASNSLEDYLLKNQAKVPDDLEQIFRENIEDIIVDI